MGPCGGSDARRWYLVHTKPRQEERAELNLRFWGVEAFGPKVREVRATPRSSAVSLRTSALFPGYIFARFDAMVMLAKVRLTRGVQSVVGFDQAATPVDDAIVDLVRSRLGADGFAHIAGPEPGDTVEIVSGPLRSLVGIFERSVRGHDRVAVLLATMGGQVRVEVSRMLVRKTTTRIV